MGFLRTLTLTALTLVICAKAVEDSEIITAPRPGEEYVFVQSSSSNARPITRKEKKSTTDQKAEIHFESSHKIPSDLKFTQKDADKVKREADPQGVPGAIKIDPLKLLEQYKDVLATSTTQRSTDSTTSNIILTTGSTVTKRSLDVQGIQGVESDAKLKSSGSEKSTSRIQVKKGPNGQDYEYEYVYYYYDDDEPENITNGHDGPARNSIAPVKNNKYTSIDRVSTEKTVEAASNEVVPQRTRGRGRQSDEVTEERLPANTRFPPRSRNLSSSTTTTTTTTAAPEEEKKRVGRPRGRSTTTTSTAAPQEAIEEAPTRSRSRPNIKRPSLELVDSASFKTHASDVSVSQYKDLPTREESATARSYDTTAEQNRAQSLETEKVKSIETEEKTSTLSESSTIDNTITTTLSDDMTAAMDKVALDLYAILQGTQNMIEDGDSQGSTDSSDATGTTESITDEVVSSTTETVTEEPTTPTTTTTTTTTTQATTTTTTTTTEAPTPALPGRGRFRGRPTNTRVRSGSATTTTTEAAPEIAISKAPSRFSPPGRNTFGGRNRINPRTTTTTEKSAEGEITKSEAAPSNAAKPIVGNRSRFGSRGRTTSSTTPAEDSAAVSAATPKPTLVRPRPGYNLNRRRGGATPIEVSSTAKSADNEEESGTEVPTVSSETPSTVAPRAGIRQRVPGTSSQVRPLRPGPKINIAPRGRLTTSTTTTTTTQSPPTAEGETSSESSSEVESTTSGTSTTENALQRLRHRSRIAAPTVTPKPKAPSPTPIARRANPLIGNRRKSTTEPTTQATEEPAAAELQNEVVTESAEEVRVEASEEPISSTTEAAPARGLNGLLAGRRRINRRPGTIL